MYKQKRKYIKWLFAALLYVFLLESANSTENNYENKQIKNGVFDISFLEKGDFTIGIGYLNTTKKFQDRIFAFSYANIYSQFGIGVHYEATWIKNQEENKLFSIGLSYNQTNFQIKTIFGNNNSENSLPEYTINLETVLQSSAETGIVFTPSITWQSYHNNHSEWILSANLTKYISVDSDAAVIIQGFGNINIGQSGHQTSARFGLAGTYSVYKQWSASLSTDITFSDFTRLPDPTAIMTRKKTKSISIRPSIGYFIDDNTEIITQVEFSKNDDYTALGGQISLKISF